MVGLHSWGCRLYACTFFFKQKTAYEMSISDWSSDVCSSDHEPELGQLLLHVLLGQHLQDFGVELLHDRLGQAGRTEDAVPGGQVEAGHGAGEIGRASCWERVGQCASD